MPQVRCPELIGRDAELATLVQALDAARTGGGGLWFVTGEPGVGKSRLAREVAAEARRRGCTVLAGRAVESSAPAPYRPISEALMASFRPAPVPTAPELAPFRAALGRLVPEWRDWPLGELPIEAAGDSAMFLAEGVLRLLSLMAQRRATLLVLEDLHWSDPDTLGVLEYLADHLSETSVMCLATLRSEPSAAQDQARLLTLRRAATTIDLQRLGDEATRRMLRACIRSIGAGVPPRAMEQTLLARAEGVPLVVEELLAAATDEHEQRVEDALPLTFADAVQRRVARLPEDGRAIVRAAATLGRRFDWTLLVACTGLDEERVTQALRAAVANQLVVSETTRAPDYAYRFRHALTRDAILAELLPHERALFAERALAALEAAHPVLEGSHCELAADLSAAAGDTEHAATLLLEASRRSLRNGALATAEQTLHRARGLTRDGSLGLQLDVLLIDVLSLAGKADEAFLIGNALLTRADADWPSGCSRADVHLRLARAAVAATLWDRAETQLDRAREQMDPAHHAPNSEQRAAIDALSAQVAIGQGRFQDAARLAERALAVAEQVNLPALACEALEVIGRRDRTVDFDRAEAVFERGRSLAERAGLRVWEIRALHELGTIGMLRDLQLERLVEARALAYEAGALVTAATLDQQIASTHLYRWEPDDGLQTAHRCEEAARRFGLRLLLPSALLTRAACHALRAERADMEAALNEALQLAADDPHLRGAAWLTARGLLSLVQEERSRALQEMDRGVELLRQTAALPYPMRAVWALVRTLEQQEGEKAREDVRDSGAALLPVNAAILTYAEAVACGQAGDRSGAERAFDEAESLLAARPGASGLRFLALRLVGEAALQDGWGKPVDWLSQAAAFFASGSYGRLAMASRGLLRQHGVPVARKGRGEASVPHRLQQMGITSREMDVLLLLGLRLSDRQIGERLVLSPRTIEKHVERLLRKTGLQSRVELATLAATAAGEQPRR